MGRRQGIPDDKLEAIERYADHPGFTEREIVELTAQAAFENFRARFNRSLRIEADDLAKRRAKHPAAAP